MSVSLSPILNGYQSFLSSGLPNNGGFIYTYQAGTTTPAATYTTNSGGTPNANPIPLSADGRPPQEIWLTDGSAYKFVITDSTTAPIAGASFDNITGSASSSLPLNLSSSGGSALVGFIQSGTGAIARTVQDKNREKVSLFDFMTAAQIADVQAGTLTLDPTGSIALAANALGANGGIIECPPGIYKFPQAAAALTSKNNIHFRGAGQGATTFRSTVAVGTPTAGTPIFLQFTTCTNISIRGITFDVNSILTTAANTMAVAFTGGNDIEFIDCAIINGTRLGIGFGGTNRFRVEDSYFKKSGSPVNSFQNEAIFTTISSGSIQTGFICRNICDGWGMLCSGNDLHFFDNYVANFGYGGGITVNADSGTNHPVIVGNTVTGGIGLDVNNTQCLGIECWAPYAIIHGNNCYLNAGSGISFGGEYSVVTGNSCINNGSYNNTGVGIAVPWFAGQIPASYSVVANNILGDTGTGYQLNGYGESSVSGANFVNIKVFGNSVFGNTGAAYNFGAFSTQEQFDGYVYEASASYTIPAITKGNSDAGLTFTVAGAAMGDFVEVSCSVQLQGLIASGYVTAANQVQVIFFNGFSASITVGAATIRARVHQHR
jgi:hypothetical protein